MTEKVTQRRKQIIQLVVLLICFFGIRMILKSYVVNGPMLEPALYNGDRILVETISPKFSSIHAGDIVLCVLPALQGQEQIRRVVGAPGDVVEIHDHSVWVNGEQIPNSFTPEPDRPEAEVVPAGQYFLLDVNLVSTKPDAGMPAHGLVDRADIHAKSLWRYWPLSRS